MRGSFQTLVVALATVFTGATGIGAGEVVRFVDKDAPDGGDGLTWETAYRHLQDALEEAEVFAPIEVIRVAHGIYRPSDGGSGPTGPEASFHLLEGLRIEGGYAGLGAADPDFRDVNHLPTVLTGFLADGVRAHHVVRALSVDGTAVLDGVTIQEGRAFGSCCQSDRGGGIYFSNSDAIFRSCRIQQNSASNIAAGLWISGSNPLFEECIIRDNHSTIANHGAGAAIVFGSHATFVRCSFISNHLEGYSTGGGAIVLGDYGPANSVTAIDCRFLDNRGSAGGACLISGQGLFINCIFSGNVAFGEGFGSFTGRGGAILSGGETQLVNCVFANNIADVAGGGASTSPPFSKSPFDAALIVTNCIFWDNEAPTTLQEAQITIHEETTLLLRYSCVEGLTGTFGGPGNIGLDPLLVDPDGIDGVIGTLDDNLHLLPGSPAIDAGDNWGVLRDAGDADGDGRVHELWPFDLGGNPRFADGSTEPDPGCGIPVVVDMGPYEHGDGGSEIIFADLNADGVVDLLDLLQLLNGWGPVTDCLPDLDINESIGESDLLLLLDAWDR